MFSARGKNRTVNIEAIIILWLFIDFLNRLSCVEIDLVTVIRSTKHRKSYTELLILICIEKLLVRIHANEIRVELI